MTALTEPRNAGRARYWFGAEVWTNEWAARRLEEVVAKAGRRYSPRLHIEVEAVQAMHAVGRVDEYAHRWRLTLADPRESRQWTWRAPEGLVEVLADVLRECERSLDEADSSLEGLIAAAQGPNELPVIAPQMAEADRALREVERTLCVTRGQRLGVVSQRVV